jgi:acyl-CoA thioesterase-1
MNHPFLKILILVAALWLPNSAYAAKHILVFGDSLSAGYGIAVEQSWPALLEQELKHSRVKFQLTNASISGETTVGGLQRIANLLVLYQPNIIIVELGANDGLRGSSTADIESNLNGIIELAEHLKIKILLVGMKLPPNYGEPYVTQFQRIYPRIAEKHAIPLLPFLLEGVNADQFQPDNLHPSAAAQAQIMRNVLQVLRPLLR